MILPAETPVESRSSRSRRRGGWTVRLSCSGMLLLLIINALILGLLGWPLWQARQGLQATLIPSQTIPVEKSPSPEAQASEPSLTPSLSPTPRPNDAALQATFNPLATLSLEQGSILLSLREGPDTHLFLYQPEALPLVRLTYGPWDDLDPSLSPDGEQLAFSSNRNGYWDLYLLELASGLVRRLTDTLEYEAAPTWSPDGRWMAYETYLDGNLEIVIRSVSDQEGPIRLTSHAAADFAPAWSPGGREIAFVSTRSGEPEIWLINLDQADESLYQNLSQNPSGVDLHPAWAHDGSQLAWASVRTGLHQIYVWQPDQPKSMPRSLGNGDWPAWSPDGKTLLTVLEAPNQIYLTGYLLETPGLSLPALKLPSPVAGLAWGEVDLPWPLQDPYKQAALLTPTPLWLPVLTPVPESPAGRQQVVELEDVEAQYALLHDLVDESFQALRTRLATEIGWDFLSTLENAYVPLTSPLEPGMGDDWLYTGRAFAFTSLPASAGWLVVQKEEFGFQTYWRVYLRARYQDGSAGTPLHQPPWDFNQRYDGGVVAYEQGGAPVETIPAGYWVDLTDLALAYGWERQPALIHWRASLAAARFNEFALTDGLDWLTAMLEIYPPEVLITPSPVVPPTLTLTSTPRWYQSPTPTQTPTPRPTLTPLPPTPSRTPTASPTPAPSSTSTRAPTRTATPRPTNAPTLTSTSTPVATQTGTAEPSGTP